MIFEYKPKGNKTSDGLEPPNVNSAVIKCCEKTENEIFSFSERVIKEVVKRDDEYTKQVIRDYFTNKYPKENLRFDFLDEEIVNEIIKLGITEYQRIQALGGVLGER